MGLFGFVGKLAKAAVGVAKFAGVPGAGAASGVLGQLLKAKRPMGSITEEITAAKGPGFVRGNLTQSMGASGMMTARELRSTPVMPGGAVSTRSGMRGAASGAPPKTYGSAGGGKKRRTGKKKASATRGTRKRTAGRKLKFGSPAWRAKYMKRKK